MKILILGGNRFFGKKLAHNLVELGHDLTLLNRGNANDDLGGKVNRIHCDRNDINKLKSSFKDHSWDVVYDQICYDFDQAQQLCNILEGKTEKLIFTSSQSVYNPGEHLKESDFLPESHNVANIAKSAEDYAEAKRQAEVAFTKHASFPVTLVRFPIVIGNDDYTKRFHFHVERIKKEKPIYFPNIEAKISFISSDFAAKTLSFFLKENVIGPINVASPNPITLKRFIEIIEEKIGKKAKLISNNYKNIKECHSPYGIEQDWFMSCQKLESLGPKGAEIEDWLPSLL